MQTVSQFRAALRAPICPGQHNEFGPPQRMLWRPGWWKCYLHEEPIVIEIKTKLPRAPRGDVIRIQGRRGGRSRVDDMLDYRWNDQTQTFEVVELDGET